jgi:hypothetical protein
MSLQSISQHFSGQHTFLLSCHWNFDGSCIHFSRVICKVVEGLFFTPFYQLISMGSWNVKASLICSLEMQYEISCYVGNLPCDEVGTHHDTDAELDYRMCRKYDVMWGSGQY